MRSPHQARGSQHYLHSRARRSGILPAMKCGRFMRANVYRFDTGSASGRPCTLLHADVSLAFRACENKCVYGGRLNCWVHLTKMPPELLTHVAMSGWSCLRAHLHPAGRGAFHEGFRAPERIVLQARAVYAPLVVRRSRVCRAANMVRPGAAGRTLGPAAAVPKARRLGGAAGGNHGARLATATAAATHKNKIVAVKRGAS